MVYFLGDTSGEVVSVEAGQNLELHAEFKYDRLWFDFTNLTEEAKLRQKKQKQQNFMKRILEHEASKAEADTN